MFVSNGWIHGKNSWKLINFWEIEFDIEYVLLILSSYFLLSKYRL